MINLKKNINYTVSYDVTMTLHHIIDMRIKNCKESERMIWLTVKDIVTYALDDNLECLKEFDYLD